MLEIINGKKIYDGRVIFEKLNIRFPNKGVFMILGPSGCGKSTLLNVLSGLEKLDEGIIKYNGKTLKNDALFLNFRRKHLAFLFQDYGLIDNYSIYQNINFPLMIQDVFLPKTKIKQCLKKVNLNKNINIKCQYLSGGEKQRVALARVLISDSDIILCDEPSGSLDKENSINTFLILKELSKTKLIICVSHDIDLANKYGDYIYEFNRQKDFYFDGENIKDKNIKKIKNISIKDSVSLSLSSLIYRNGRSLLSTLACSVVILFLILTMSFSSSLTTSISKNMTRYLNYNQLTIIDSESSPLGNSGFSLVKMRRPNKEKLLTLLNGYHFQLNYNFDYLFSSAKILVDNKEKQFYFKPISFISDGKFSYLERTFKTMKIDEVIINKKSEELMKHSLSLKLKQTFETRNNLYNKSTDILNLELELKVIEVVDEFDFMSIPIIYYSYDAYQQYLMNLQMDNASQIFNRSVTYYDRLSILSNDDEDVSSYSFLLFVDEHEVVNIHDKLVQSGYEVDSFPLQNSKNLIDILSSIRTILFIFGILSIVIVIFLTGMIMYSNVIDRKKEIGIFHVIGLTKHQINFIVCFDGIILGFISAAVAVIGTPFLMDKINLILEKYIRINNFLFVPYINFGTPFNCFYSIIILVSTALGVLLGYIPSYIINKNRICDILRD